MIYKHIMRSQKYIDAKSVCQYNSGVYCNQNKPLTKDITLMFIIDGLAHRIFESEGRDF